MNYNDVTTTSNSSASRYLSSIEKLEQVYGPIFNFTVTIYSINKKDKSKEVVVSKSGVIRKASYMKDDDLNKSKDEVRLKCLAGLFAKILVLKEEFNKEYYGTTR